MPTLIDVSVRPSVSDQPAGHFDRSIVNPSGPVSVLPSADTPHLLSVMRLTIAARWVVQSASQASIDVGWGWAAVVAVAPPAAVVSVPPPNAACTPALTPASTVLSEALPPLPPLSSPPHAAATSARPTRPAL